MRPRWKKVLHDLFDNKTRTLMVVLSIMIGVAAIGVIAGAYGIIAHDMNASYAANDPMNLELRTTYFGSEVVDTVGRMDSVERAEGRNVFTARARPVGDSRWTKINLVAIEDYTDTEINRLELLDGAAEPGQNQVLLEKKAVETLRIGTGDVVQIQLEDGSIKELRVVGTVQDQATGAGDFLASPFAYLAMDSLANLKQPELFNRMIVVTSSGQDDSDHLRQVATDVKDKLEKNGVVVFRSSTSKTHEHPLSATVQAILGILGALGVLILFLSSSLIANTLASLLNQHMRYIGIMKLVGGRRSQILGLYILLILTFSAFSLLIGIPLGGQGAYALSRFIADKVNFAVLGYRIVPYSLLIQLIVGLGVPLLVGLPPVLKGSHITVQRALSNDLVQPGVPKGHGHQAAAEHTLQTRLNQALARRGIHFPRPFLISLRNIFRRKQRLLLTLVSLTMGGAIFIAVFNVRVTLHDYLAQVGKYFTADITLHFNQPYRVDRVDLEARKVPGVVRTEGWAIADAEALYADGSTADNMILLAPPAASTLVEPIMVSGRWLQPGDEKTVTISENILKAFPHLKPGDRLRLKVNGKEDDWLLVGLFKFVDQEGTIGYSTYEYVSRLTGQANRSFSYRVVTAQHDDAYQEHISELLDQHFRARGYKLEEAQTGRSTFQLASESLDILVTFLLIMALLTAAVGSIGLAGTMSMNVMERTREIGVMRSIGAKNSVIMRMVILEGAVIGGLSWLLAVIFSFPITYLLATIVSLAVFDSPIAIHFTAEGFLIWLAGVLLLSTIASILPARSAARLTIREVLAYE